MKQVYEFFRGLLVLLVLLAAVAALSSVAAFVAGMNSYLVDSGGWETLDYSEAQALVDGLTDSGVAAPSLDPDEPLLAQRRIVVAEGMNELTARHVVERLLYLDRLDPEEPIDLLLCTSGGWTDSAFAIVDTMRSIDAPVDVTAIGGCYSAGTLILAAGTGVRAATPNALMSVHVNDYYRDVDEFHSDTTELERFRALYDRHTDVPAEWFETPGDNQYYFDAERALEMRLIDEIAPPQWQAPEADREPARPAA